MKSNVTGIKRLCYQKHSDTFYLDSVKMFYLIYCQFFFVSV